MKLFLTTTLFTALFFTACTSQSAIEQTSVPTETSTPITQTAVPSSSSSAALKNASPTAKSSQKVLATKTPTPKPTSTPTSQSTSSNTSNTNPTPTPIKTPAPTSAPTATPISNANYDLRITIPTGDTWKHGQNVQFGWWFSTTNQNIASTDYPLYIAITLEQNGEVKKSLGNTIPSYEGSALRWPWTVPSDLAPGAYTIRIKFQRQLMTPQGLRNPEATTTVNISNNQPLFSNYSSELTRTNAKIAFTYTGDPAFMDIFFSTSSDMSNPRNVKYIRQNENAAYYWVDTPSDIYQCGATIYWQVKIQANVGQGDIQQGVVTCN